MVTQVLPDSVEIGVTLDHRAILETKDLMEITEEMYVRACIKPGFDKEVLSLSSHDYSYQLSTLKVTLV
jgi:hypothetical protein